MTSSVFCVVDDKHVPVYRVMWVADTPHFCGREECQVEGRYEIRLDQDESVFGTSDDRDNMLAAMERWASGAERDENWS